MAEPITIRPLGPADLERLCAEPPGLFDNPVIRSEAEVLLNDSNHIMIVAISGERLVSVASGTVLRHPDKPPALFVNEVGTRPEWQRRGLARQVTEALIGWAQETGCEGVWLATETENRPALELYRAMAGDERTITGFAWDGAFDGE